MKVDIFNLNFNNNFDSSYYKNFIFDYNNNQIIKLFKDKNQKFIVKGKNKRNFKKYLIFTHNEETNKQFLINFKNNKIQSIQIIISLKNK